MSQLHKTWLLTACRWFCGGVFLYASMDKLGEAARFTQAIREYHMVPLQLEPLAGVVVPWMEFFTGVALLVGLRWRGAALVYCGLMVTYSLALSWNMVTGVEMNCGCFSLDSVEKATWWTVGRDVALLMPGLAVLWTNRSFATLDGWLKLPDA
jgi:uncharacterized membrane protein YphA (DoxX/SURF4 family)